MKRLLCALLAICLAALTLTACAQAERPAGKANDISGKSSIQIGIIQYVSHSSLQNCTDGIVAALNASPLAGKLNIDIQVGTDASADADCAAYAAQMVAKGYDMIFAVATPAAQSAFAATESIPVIFCAVSDPVAASLVKTNEKPTYNASGTSDVLDLAAQLDLILSMQPNAKKIGILYTTSEANSLSNLAVMRTLAAARSLEIDAIGVQSASDIPAAATALAARVDCLNNFTDNNVVQNLPVLLEAAKNAGIPVYGSEVEQVKLGCLAAVSIDYLALGKTTGEIAVRVLCGENPGEIAVATISDATPVINTDVLAAIGLTMPASYANAETVTTTK